MFRKPKIEQQPEFLIVGLGNPGPEYARTRHNMGFEVIELLAKRHKIKLNNRKMRSVYGMGEIRGRVVCIAEPMTYMNLSGEAIAALLRHFNLPITKLLIVYDDLALDIGRLRARARGSSGGHNGLKSIQHFLKTSEYSRLRIGIGASNAGETIDYVLGTFYPEERDIIDIAIVNAANAVEMWIHSGIESVMKEYNAPPPVLEKLVEQNSD